MKNFIFYFFITILVFSFVSPYTQTFAQAPGGSADAGANVEASSGSTVSAAAPQEYVVLAPLPGIGDGGSNGKTTLETYLPNIFNLMVGIAAALAFIMITWGGVTYATSDALSTKSEGKNYIENAVWGLLLVIGAWVILNTINPQILNFDLVLPKSNIQTAPGVSVGGGGSGGGGQALPGYVMSDAQIADHIKNKNKLYNDSGGKINTNTTEPCKTRATTGCTNLNDLPGTAITGILQTQKDCGNCSILITGGTEGGHVTHGPGKSAVDFRPSSELTGLLGVDGANPGMSNYQKLPQKTLSNGQKVTFMWETNPPHWHVTFP